jgi:hypothetical protein
VFFVQARNDVGVYCLGLDNKEFQFRNRRDTGNRKISSVAGRGGVIYQYQFWCIPDQTSRSRGLLKMRIVLIKENHGSSSRRDVKLGRSVAIKCLRDEFTPTQNVSRDSGARLLYSRRRPPPLNLTWSWSRVRFVPSRDGTGQFALVLG